MIPNPATSPEALAAYGDLVNSVAEAAKSSSSAAASLSFSMTRPPGMFSFLYATSVNIKDVDTLGSEAVCTTAVYYCFMQSIDDLKNEAEFNLTKIDVNSLVHMKTLQAALIDELANGAIDINIWMAKDTAYSMAIQKLQDRVNAHRFKNGLDMVPVNVNLERIPSQALSVANAAIEKLVSMGAEFKAALAKTKHRVESLYF